jgi:ABC-type sugar transport system permease subunit
MAVETKQKGVAPGGASLFSTIVTYGALALLNALALTLIYGLLDMGNVPLAVVLGIIAFGATIIFFVPRFYPIRWMVPGLAFMILLVLYPIYFTVSNAFTNYGDGHLYAKQQSINLITARKYVPAEANVYRWEVMQADDGRYALYLTREVNGVLEAAFAPEGDPIEVVAEPTAEAPETYNGFRLLTGADRTTALGLIQNAVFGLDDDTVGIRTRREAARPLKDRFVYDPATDTITDQTDGRVYVANNELGQFVPQDGQGDPLAPGYIVGVGLNNFVRFISDPGLRGPLIDIFVWTVVFSLFSVLSTFALGLMMALILNSPYIIGRKVIQSLLIIPYAIPAVISIMVWRALLNQNFGLINKTLMDLGLVSQGIPFLTDAAWAKFSILLVNLWLGYPYMMLICSGALQAIPSDVYEAAAVDGARPWQAFRSITLPLLLVTVGPLLIASFTYNFNNFLLIDALTGGNPPIPGSPVQAGYTDILISYTYRLAFGNRGADYGYASAITLVIFALVALVTVFQTRFNNQWEKVIDNG